MSTNFGQTWSKPVTVAAPSSSRVYWPWVAIGPVNASGCVVHYGQVCQGGTTCVATGQDRPLGDYFTNALDARGCVLIASGDTMMVDPLTGVQLPTARPIFTHQHAGPALVGKGSCS